MEVYRDYKNNGAGGNRGFYQFWEARKGVPVNTILIFVNVLVFLLVELTGSSTDTRHMLEWGASGTLDIAAGHEYYRLFTCMFLHFGIQHLGNNMLVLFFVGDCLERKIGSVKYAVLYLAGGIGANILSFTMELSQGEYVVSAGASGAVFAVIGGLFYVVVRNKGRLENFTSRQILALAVLSLYHGVVSAGVDNTAHFGGLLGGLLLSVLLYHKKK